MAVGVHVGSFTKQAGTGNQDITLPADVVTAMNAGPYAIKFWTTGADVASGTWKAHAVTSLGFVGRDSGGTITQYAASTASLDNVATSDAARGMAAKAITLVDSGGASHLAQAELGATPLPSSTTMRINWTSNTTGGTYGATVINYMIVTGLTNAKVVAWDTPASTGSVSVTTVGFSSDLILSVTTLNTAIPHSEAYAASLGFGVVNKHGQSWANSFASGDALATSNASRWQQTDAMLIQVSEGEDSRSEAKWTEMLSNGFSAYFAENDVGARKVFSLCMEGVSSKIGAFTKTTTAAPTTQTVDSRQGFTPKGVLLSNIGSATPSGSPSAYAMWGLGASDLTNERAAALVDADAVSPTDANSLWHSDKAITVAGGDPGGQTLAAADMGSVAADTFALGWTTNNAGAYELLYLLLGDPGTDTFPASSLDSATTNAAATAYSNQKKAKELSNGYIVRVVGETTTNARFEYSTDGGQTWVDYAADIAGWNNGSIDSYVDSGGTERLVAVWKQSGTGGGRTDGLVYVMVGSFNVDRTTLAWGTAATPSGAGVYSTAANYPDVVCTADGTGGQVMVFASVVESTPTNFTVYARYPVNGSGVLGTLSVDGLTSAGGGSSWGYFTVHGNNVHTFPSAAIDLTTKRLFVAWSAGTTGAGKGIRYRTASYSGGAWTWATEVEVSTSFYVPGTSYWLNCRWDGTRVVIGGWLYGVSSRGDIEVWDSTNFTAFTNRVNLGVTAGANDLNEGGMAVDAAGDVYLFGTAYDGTNYLGTGYRKAARSGTTLTLGSYVVTDHYVRPGSSAFPSAFPITGGIGWVYTRGNNSPYAVAYDRIRFFAAVPDRGPVTRGEARDRGGVGRYISSQAA